MILPYPPEEVDKFYCYYYEWVDYLGMMANPYDVIDNYHLYEKSIKKAFVKYQWDEENPIQVIWIPPFVMSKILVGGETALLEKYGKLTIFDDNGISPSSCTLGLFLFHAKNINDGTSIILSPFELDISDYLIYP